MPSSSIPSLSNNSNNAVGSLRILKDTKIVPLPTASPDEACCICLQLYGPSHQAVTVLIKDCWHRFGKECLNKYLNSNSPRNNTCPQCRCIWYIRRSAWSPRDTNTTEALAPFSIPRAPARAGSRAATYRTHLTLEHYQETNNNVITNHIDEIFRRLDLIQDISRDQVTSTADTRVRLEAIERRARRIHQDLQSPHENTDVSMLQSTTLRGHEIRRRLGQPSQRENTARRRWVEAFAVELDDPSNLSRASLPPTVSIPEEARVVTPANDLADVHPALRSPPPGDSPEPDEPSRHRLRRRNHVIDSSSLRPRHISGAPTLATTVSAFPSSLSSESSFQGAHSSVTLANVGSVAASIAGSATSTLSPITSDTAIHWLSDSQSPNFDGFTPISSAILHPSLRPQEPRSEFDASQQPTVSDLTPQEELRRRAPENFQTTLARRTASAGLPESTSDSFQAFAAPEPVGSPPTRRFITPGRIPQRRSSLGNLLELPTLRSSPSSSSKPSMSNRTQHGVGTRDTSQSKGKSHWLRRLPRVSSLSSLILPGNHRVQDARTPRWPAAGRSSVANEVFRSNYWADPAARR